MTNNPTWRSISSDEVAMVTAIISASELLEAKTLINELDGAVVSPSTRWIFDVKPSNVGPAVNLPNGPFPGRAFVPSRADYRGEVIIWIKDGHLSGLEYAWVTDDPPTRWPWPEEMEIVKQ